MNTLHYLFDPLCGWCHAAAPLVAAARDVPGLDIQLHAGGMLVGAHRRGVTPELRDYVLAHDRKIAALTGQPFGAAYMDGLLCDPSAILDSEPPTTAVLAAQEMAHRGLDMLAQLQQAHYMDGRKIADTDVLADVAGEIGLERAKFLKTFESLQGAPTHEHIAATRRCMDEFASTGFPTFVFERDNGMLSVQEVSHWMGNPQGWQRHLADLVAAANRTTPAI